MATQHVMTVQYMLTVQHRVTVYAVTVLLPVTIYGDTTVHSDSTVHSNSTMHSDTAVTACASTYVVFSPSVVTVRTTLPVSRAIVVLYLVRVQPHLSVAEKQETYRCVLDDFLRDTDRKRMSFRPEFTSYDRMVIHEVSRCLFIFYHCPVHAVYVGNFTLDNKATLLTFRCRTLFCQPFIQVSCVDKTNSNVCIVVTVIIFIVTICIIVINIRSIVSIIFIYVTCLLVALLLYI